MTQRFKVGDAIVVNGTRQVVQSWPEDDHGFYVTVHTVNGGAEVWNTHHTATTNPEPFDAAAPHTLAEVHAGLQEPDESGDAGLDELEAELNAAEQPPTE